MVDFGFAGAGTVAAVERIRPNLGPSSCRICTSETIFLKQFFWLGELLRRGCQGRTQYYELLTCVLVSPTPQVPNNHIDEAVDEEEDMKYKRVQDGAGLITFQISEIVEKFLFFILFGTL